MKAKMICAATLLALLAGTNVPNPARATETLYLYTWADFFPEQVINDFTKETGIEVKQAFYDTVEMPETKFLAPLYRSPICVATSGLSRGSVISFKY